MLFVLSAGPDNIEQQVPHFSLHEGLVDLRSIVYLAFEQEQILFEHKLCNRKVYFEGSTGTAHPLTFEGMAQGKEQNLLGLAVLDQLLALLPLIDFVVVAYRNVVLDEDILSVLLLDDANLAKAWMLKFVCLVVSR